MKATPRKLALLLSVLLLFLSGCTEKAKGPSKPLSPLSVWSVYWDNESAADDLVPLKKDLQSLHYFAAYFDENAQIFLPQTLLQSRQEIQKKFGSSPPWDSFLTFVNDQKFSDGSSSLKSTELLYTLLETEADRAAHIADILKTAADGGYDGVEIDYEAIRSDMTLWAHFIDFITALSQQAAEQKLKLRVVLEPGIPYDSLSFPAEAEYVVMCYNLYGYGTAPGPKADDDFLRMLTEKTASLPGRRIFALASDGFLWQGDKAQPITEQDAKALVRRHKAKPKRDAASQALTFSYEENGTACTVFYADAATLRHWNSVLASCGDFGIALWRLGGTDAKALAR